MQGGQGKGLYRNCYCNGRSNKREMGGGGCGYGLVKCTLNSGTISTMFS